jgi:hypothetical protein
VPLNNNVDKKPSDTRLMERVRVWPIVVASPYNSAIRSRILVLPSALMSPFWRIALFPVSFDLPCTLKQSRRREGGQIVGPENELPLPLIKTGCGLLGSVD